MLDNKPNQRLFALAEKLLQEVNRSTQPLSQGSPTSIDHGSARSLIETSALLEVLERIHECLYILTHRERMQQFPQSMLNKDKGQF